MLISAPERHGQSAGRQSPKQHCSPSPCLCRTASPRRNQSEPAAHARGLCVRNQRCEVCRRGTVPAWYEPAREKSEIKGRCRHRGEKTPSAREGTPHLLYRTALLAIIPWQTGGGRGDYHAIVIALSATNTSE
jgi:hypothetical protein